MVNDFLFFLVLFIFGIAIGSFLNVLIDRLPQERSINGRSRCDSCKKTLHWYDLIPVFSFLLLKGKCRYCHRSIPARLPLVEIITGVIFIVSWLYLGHNLLTKIAYLAILSSLIVIFFADFKYQIIPDSIQLILVIFSTLLLYESNAGIQFFLPSFMAGLGIMFPILLLFLITSGRGMGFGDVKLAFTIGYLFGVFGGFIVLYIAFISGGVVGLVLIWLQRKKMKSKIAFGPFLVFGMLLVLFYGDEIITVVKRIYGIVI